MIPVEVAAIHDHAAHGCAMSTSVFGGRVRDDVRTPLERTAQVGRGQRVIDHQWDVIFLRDFGGLFQRENVHQRIAERFTVNDLGIFLDGTAEVLRVGRVYESHVDAQARESVPELADRPAIQGSRRNNMIARLANRKDGRCLRGMPGTDLHRTHAPFQVCHALFEHVAGRVADAGVDIAGFLESKQTGGAIRALQVVGSGLVDGHSPRTGRLFGRISRMQLPGGKSKFSI